MEASWGLFASFDYRYVGEGYKKKYEVGYAGSKKKTIDYWVADAQVGYQHKGCSVTLDGDKHFWREVSCLWVRIFL